MQQSNQKENHQLQLSDKQGEKSDKEKLAEDIAYTINHAVSCTTLDLLGGTQVGSKLSSEYVTPAIQKSLRNIPYLKKFSDKNIELWCSHSFGKWTIAEVAGDISSVVPTIALQKFAPSSFTALEHVLEPAFGWAFKGGARRGAERWAKEHDLSKDDQRVKDYQETLYKHEVEHLPHAFIWGAVSLPVSGEILTLFGHDAEACGHDHGHDHSSHDNHPHNEHKHSSCSSHHDSHKDGHSHSKTKKPHWQNLRTNMLHVLGGKIFSSVVLLGARSAYPDKAHTWDRWASDTIYYPVTKGVSGLLGVDEETVNRVRDKHDALHQAPEISEPPESNITLPVTHEKLTVEKHKNENAKWANKVNQHEQHTDQSMKMIA